MCTQATAVEGEAGATKRPYAQRTGNGHKDIGDILFEPWGDEPRESIANSRRVAAEQVEQYKDTFDKAAGNRYDGMKFANLLKLLAEGLTGDGRAQFAVVPGKIFFKSAKL